jgi:uracil phosphoribosyltransferase
VKNHRHTRGVLCDHRRLPPTTAALIQQVRESDLVFLRPKRELHYHGLVFFHVREDTSFTAMHTTPPAATVTDRHPNLSVIHHPLIEHKLGLLRDRATPTKLFKELIDEIAMLMAFAAMADLPLEPVTIETPLERSVVKRVSGKKLTLVPVLRAGLGMVEGVLRLVPSARVGHIGLYRDHDTLEPVDYYFKVPGDAAERHFMVLDPMLATGGSAAAAVTSLKRAGARQIRFLCIVAAPAGVERMGSVHPDVPIFSAALDRELNPLGYILPGLGDAGDRMFGTR